MSSVVSILPDWDMVGEPGALRQATATLISLNAVLHQIQLLLTCVCTHAHTDQPLRHDATTSLFMYTYPLLDVPHCNASTTQLASTTPTFLHTPHWRHTGGLHTWNTPTQQHPHTSHLSAEHPQLQGNAHNNRKELRYSIASNDFRSNQV